MELKTKYNIGDTIKVPDKYNILNGIVDAITIHIYPDSRIEINYRYYSDILSNRVFGFIEEKYINA